MIIIMTLDLLAFIDSDCIFTFVMVDMSYIKLVQPQSDEDRQYVIDYILKVHIDVVHFLQYFTYRPYHSFMLKVNLSTQFILLTVPNCRYFCVMIVSLEYF